MKIILYFIACFICSQISLSQQGSDGTSLKDSGLLVNIMPLNRYILDKSVNRLSERKKLADSIKNYTDRTMSFSLSTGLVEFFSLGTTFKISEQIDAGLKWGYEFLGGERGSTFLGIVALPTLGIKMDYKFKEFLLCPEPIIRINVVGLEAKSIGLLKTNYYKNVTGGSYYLFIGSKNHERGVHYYWTFGLSFSRVSNCHDLFFPQFTVGYNFNLL